MHPCTCLSCRNRAYLTIKPGGEASLEAPVGWDWSGLVFHPNRACAVLRYTRRGLILSPEFDPTQWQLSKDGLTYRRSTPVSRTAHGRAASSSSVAQVCATLLSRNSYPKCHSTS